MCMDWRHISEFLDAGPAVFDEFKNRASGTRRMAVWDRFIGPSTNWYLFSRRVVPRISTILVSAIPGAIAQMSGTIPASALLGRGLRKQGHQILASKSQKTGEAVYRLIPAEAKSITQQGEAAS